MGTMDIFLYALVILIILYLLFNLRRSLIFEHERGLLYQNGKFVRILQPGQHWSLRFMHAVQKVDLRKRVASVSGQELLSADNISLKISLAASYKIEDPYKAVTETTNFQEALYTLLQLHARDLIGALPIDELLARRKEMGEALYAAAKDKALEMGLKLEYVNLKDIMFPGELKNIFAQVVNARNEGLAALERARGESAALRNLANSAKLLEGNPGLMHLRLMQALSSASGNTVILTSSLDQVPLILPPKAKKPGK
jgi:regulator of protease activity HflC (stomatin/prohibitin superfamily)